MAGRATPAYTTVARDPESPGFFHCPVQVTMRTLFRILGFAGLVLVVLSIQVLRSPETPLVLTEVLDDWYGKQMIWCGIIGLVAGGIGAWVAMGRVRHRPKRPASDFLGRVARV